MIDRRLKVRALAAAAPLVAAALLAIACSPIVTPTPQLSAGPTESPGLSSTRTLPPPVPSSAATACALDDLEASLGRVEGAAGSRFATIALVSAIDCSVDAFPAVGLRDATGESLVGSAAGGPGRIDLVGGDTYTSNVRLANWCAPEPAFPLRLVIHLGEEELPVGGSVFADDGDLPPCNGAGGPILEAIGWGLP